LSSEVLGISENSRSSAPNQILSFKEQAPAPKGNSVNNLKVLYSSSASVKNTTSLNLASSQIFSDLSRILDAPGLLGDYYINLISWSDKNLLVAALE